MSAIASADWAIGRLLASIPSQPHGHIDSLVYEKLRDRIDRIDFNTTLGELTEIVGLVSRAVFLVKEGGKTNPGGPPPTIGSPAAAQIAVAA